MILYQVWNSDQTRQLYPIQAGEVAKAEVVEVKVDGQVKKGATITLNLVKDQTYTFIFWAQDSQFKGFSTYILFALVFGLLFWFLYNKTTHGKYMYAIGGNENAAEVSGVNVRKKLTTIYALAGVMYAFAGFLMTGKSGGASAGMGTSYELEAIAGCTIGGVSTTGGIGTVPGILVGVLVFELLKIVLQFLGVDPNYNYIVQGLVVITAVAMDIRKYVAKK